MATVLAWPRKLVRLYEATQVELHGYYSIERLRAFHDYAAFKSSAPRFIVLLLTTPWPCLAMMLLLEAVPLQSPSLGTTRNVVFWAPSDTTMFIFTLSFIALCQKAVPERQLSTSKVVPVALVVTSGTQLCGFVMSITIGFPVPFNLFIGDSATGLSSLKDWCKVSMLVISLLFVYPLYNYAFRNASPYGQTALSLLLTVIKIAYKNAIAKSIRVQSDLKAEIVNFHVEISNVLFTTFSMQNATSEMTLVVLISVDFLHACATLYEVHHAVLGLEQLEQKIWQRGGHRGIHCPSAVDPCAHLILPSVTTVSTTVPTLVRRASMILSRSGARDGLGSVLKLTKASNERKPPGRRVSWIPHWFRRLRVAQAPASSIVVRAHVSPPSATASTLDVVVANKTKLEVASSPLNVLEHEYAAKVLQLLYLTEFMVLTEFIEFIVPLIYALYISVMIHLPNHVYFSQLATIQPDTLGPTVTKVLVYSLLELCSLFVLDWMLRQRLRFSPLVQLSFMLETHWKSVQAELMLWVVYIAQASLEHYGKHIVAHMTALLDDN